MQRTLYTPYESVNEKVIQRIKSDEYAHPHISEEELNQMCESNLEFNGDSIDLYTKYVTRTNSIKE